MVMIFAIFAKNREDSIVNNPNNRYDNDTYQDSILGCPLDAGQRVGMGAGP